ncbi:hypothetical protein LVJ94_39570 [Pendulispora rubella]|uniref:Uncharacterized protein n=1 Tax=Pendulispora rubella TaxID=2741070 RepID=A0ABZ2KY46_9BACT
MKSNQEIVETEKPETVETGSQPSIVKPLFRRYQIKIKAGIHSGAVPTGGPIGQ